MSRLLLYGIAAVALGSIWLDPFTHTMHPAGPELAPLWWRTVAWIDTGILLCFAWSLWRAEWRTAYALITISTVLSLLMNGLYVWTRGIDRFQVVFRTEEILSVYLVVIALRVVAIFLCGREGMNHGISRLQT
jgi:hypothetical protein